MSKVLVVIENAFISSETIKNLKKGYKSFTGSAKKTLKDGVALGIMLCDVKRQFGLNNVGTSEQTINTKFGKFITEEIGVSKSHRNLLMQIVSFDGMLIAINNGKVNSITEARNFMKPSNQNGNEDESKENEESAKEPKDSSTKEMDKVLNILKQLDKLEINDAVIKRRILANASKVMGVTIQDESAKVA